MSKSFQIILSNLVGFFENNNNAGFGAAWKVANVDPGSTVAVFGLGTLGLAVIYSFNTINLCIISLILVPKFINSTLSI